MASRSKKRAPPSPLSPSLQQVTDRGNASFAEDEIRCLRGKLRDRDREIQALQNRVAMYQDMIPPAIEMVREAITEAKALVERESSQRQEIVTLKAELKAANDKLKAANFIDLTSPGEAVFQSEVRKLQEGQFKPAEQETLEPSEQLAWLVAIVCERSRRLATPRRWPASHP